MRACLSIPQALRTAAAASPRPRTCSRPGFAPCGPAQRLPGARRLFFVSVRALEHARRPPCRAVDAPTEASVEDEQGGEDTIELEIRVQGMTCGGCSSRVADALKGQAHVRAVAVDLDSKLASVEVEAPSIIDALNMLPGFVQVVKDLGFEAEPHIEYQS